MSRPAAPVAPAPAQAAPAPAAPARTEQGPVGAEAPFESAIDKIKYGVRTGVDVLGGHMLEKPWWSK
jgi:hypothetical protein